MSLVESRIYYIASLLKLQQLMRTDEERCTWSWLRRMRQRKKVIVSNVSEQ